MITENCFALVEGQYTDDNVILVETILLPPPELREVTKYVGELIAPSPIFDAATQRTSIHGSLSLYTIEKCLETSISWAHHGR